MSKQIAIIGAGVSGLIAALQLESYGYKPIIFEADLKLGGRVQSDVVDGYILDKGFQVLLNAYPLAKKYLDYESLDLKPFLPGSYIFNQAKRSIIGDPLRKPSFLFSTLFSKTSSLVDKVKVFRLTKYLKTKSIEAIFKEKELTTLEYLKSYGFSDKIINTFFKPFFTGIFLETELKTSSRMFEFIFKMFSLGDAVIPAKGIQEIPNQLASKLKNTSIYFNKKVKTVSGNKVVFEDDTFQNFDLCIVATVASKIIPNLKGTDLVWKGTQNLYFEVEEKEVFNNKLIGLLANVPYALINSICFPYCKNTPNKLLSVSVVKTNHFSDIDLIAQIKLELNKYFGITVLRHLKTYRINNSLPILLDTQYSINPSETQLTETLFLAGDTLLNGSLNAAMLSGELAAKAVHEKITGNMFS